jgi:hypothetical protein
MKKIMQFIKDMLSGDNKVSSKRFWGSLTYLSALILTYILLLDSCEDIPTNKLYLMTTLYFFGSIMLGLGLFEKFKGKK